MRIGIYDIDPCDSDLIEDTREPDWHDDLSEEQALAEAECDDEDDDGGVDDPSWYL